MSESIYGREALGCFRPTPPHNIHLTLKFLGEVPDDTPGIISPTLERNIGLHTSFSLHPMGLGGFPSPERARILWMGTTGDTGSLVSLQKSVESAVSESGFPPEERKFVPHFTIGRSRRPRRIPCGERGKLPPPGGFEVKEILLVKSVPSSGGVVYEALEKYGLRSGSEAPG